MAERNLTADQCQQTTIMPQVRSSESSSLPENIGAPEARKVNRNPTAQLLVFITFL